RVKSDAREYRMDQRSEADAMRARRAACDALDCDLVRIAEPFRTLAALSHQRSKLGRGSDPVRFHRAGRQHSGATRLPLFVFVRALRRRALTLVGRQQPMLPKAHRLARIEPQPGGIPPYDMMVAGLCAMESRRDDARLRRSLGRTHDDAVVAKDGTSGRRGPKRHAPI